MGGNFSIGQQEVRPGVYFRIQNALISASNAVDKIVGVVFQADWGPLGAPFSVMNGTNFDSLYSGGNSNIINFAGQNGSNVLAIRLGTGGTNGAYALNDTASTPTVAVTAKYPGVRAISITVQDSLTDTTKRQLLVYSGTSLKETILFAKGTTGLGEPAALVAAITASSKWLTATKTSDGNKTIIAVSSVALTGGANPVITNTDFSNAFTAIEPYQFDLLCIDTNTTTVQLLMWNYIIRLYQEENLTFGVIGEPSTVPIATRLTDVAAFNDFRMGYVINGVKDASGTSYDGWQSAAIVAGLIASTISNKSITHSQLTNYVGITESFTGQQIESAINAGAIVFTMSASGYPQIEYGITTFLNPTIDNDAGFKKIRRVMTRFELLNRVDAATEPLVGQVDNNTNGQSAILATAQAIINAMIKESKLLPGGLVTIDPNTAPSGDSVWFLFAVDDLDSAEKIYLTYNFRFAPPSK